jgi:hypothetical protein
MACACGVPLFEIEKQQPACWRCQRKADYRTAYVAAYGAIGDPRPRAKVRHVTTKAPVIDEVWGIPGWLEYPRELSRRNGLS